MSSSPPIGTNSWYARRPQRFGIFTANKLLGGHFIADSGDPQPWGVVHGMSCEWFPTHAEAIAYADSQARALVRDIAEAEAVS